MKLLLLIPFSILLSFWRGYALMLNWNWFVKPKIGIDLNLIYAIGFLSVAHLLTLQYSPKENEEDQDHLKSSIFGIFYPALAIFFGWIYQMFL